MHIDDVLQTLKRKLAIVGVPEQPIRIEIDEPGEFLGLDAPLQLSQADDAIILSIRNITSYAPVALERILEHRACALAEEKRTGPLPLFGSGHVLTQLLHEYIHYAYLEYTAGKRMIGEFGQHRYDDYHDTSAPGICDTIHESWRRQKNDAHRFQAITWFLREHAKDLLSTSARLAPAVIGQVVPAMGEVFAYVKNLPVPTVTKEREAANVLRAQLISLLGEQLWEQVHLLKSYQEGRLVIVSSGERDVLHRFDPPLSADNRVHGARVQDMILHGYNMTTPKSPPIETFYVGTFIRRANGN